MRLLQLPEPSVRRAVRPDLGLEQIERASRVETGHIPSNGKGFFSCSFTKPGSKRPRRRLLFLFRKRSIMRDIQPNVMTVEEVAGWLRLPPSTIYKLCLRGEIPCIKIGKHWRFQRKHIEIWFEQKIQERNLPGKLLEGKA